MRQSIALILTWLLTAGLAAAQDAKEIVHQADQHMRGETNITEMTMQIIRPDYTREISMKSWMKGRDYALIYITAPARDRGTTFLKRGNEVWNWVPAVERVIKLPPSMMMQSWMGSDFTNDDLVRESSIVNDYTHELAGTETINGYECWKVELTPKPEAAVVWGKVTMWVARETPMQMKIEFYDEDMNLVNEMNASEVKNLGGRKFTTRWEMIPQDKEGHKTVMIYNDVEFNVPLEDNMFTEQYMKRVRP